MANCKGDRGQFLDDRGRELYSAGEKAPPGWYVRVDIPSDKRLKLREGELLPPSFDGHVAIYRKVQRRTGRPEGK